MISTTIYKEVDGKVIKSHGKVHAASRELEDFDTRMLKTLHHLECEQGSRFKVPGMPDKVLQKVWGKL